MPAISIMNKTIRSVSRVVIWVSVSGSYGDVKY